MPRVKTSRVRADAANGAVDEATLKQLLAALRAASAGDFDLRVPEGQGGLAGELTRAYNDLADRGSALADELQHVARVVHREGRLTERISLPRYRGAWKETVNAINSMIDDLVRPTTEIARVIDAVADGDLSQKMDLKSDERPLRGEFRRIGTTVHTMVDQLRSFAAEVTRVARDPRAAERREMPLAALEATDADVVLPLEEIGPFLRGLVAETGTRRRP